jgi:hypothetical protein
MSWLGMREPDRTGAGVGAVGDAVAAAVGVAEVEAAAVPARAKVGSAKADAVSTARDWAARDRVGPDGEPVTDAYDFALVS